MTKYKCIDCSIVLSGVNTINSRCLSCVAISSAIGTMSNRKDYADRNNTGKPQLSFISLDCLVPCAKVLEFGASKYTKYTQNINDLGTICQKLSNALIAVTLKRLKLETDAVHVMIAIDAQQPGVDLVKELDESMLRAAASPVTKGLGLVIVPKSKPESENTRGSIAFEPILEKKSENEIESGIPIQPTKKPPNAQHFSADWRNTESLRNSISQEFPLDVKSVGVKKDYILTITIAQETIEEFYVENVTKDWDFLMIVLTILEGLPNTSFLEHSTKGIKIQDGRNNWKKGMPVTKILDSLLRHIGDLQNGKVLDDESKLAIIGHIQCNAMFLGNKNNEDDLTEDKSLYK